MGALDPLSKAKCYEDDLGRIQSLKRGAHKRTQQDFIKFMLDNEEKRQATEKAAKRTAP